MGDTAILGSLFTSYTQVLAVELSRQNYPPGKYQDSAGFTLPGKFLCPSATHFTLKLSYKLSRRVSTHFVFVSRSESRLAFYASSESVQKILNKISAHPFSHSNQLHVAKLSRLTTSLVWSVLQLGGGICGC